MPIKINNRTFRIIRKADVEEYQVIVTEDGKRLEELTYYTDNLEDARGTITLMVGEYIAGCKAAMHRVIYR